MGVAENIAAVRRFYEAGPADDDSARVEFASPGIVWHVPGENRVSGEYRGARAVFETMPASMQPLDRWELDLHEVMGNDAMVVAIVDIRGSRYGRDLVTRGAHVFRLRDGVIVEAWGFAADQAGLDALLEPA
ncbi:MAG TPA: nuclear transport factor 2 family protein [Candidatus Limnocylindrales bacterium]